jgi:hypothetical protein
MRRLAFLGSVLLSACGGVSVYGSADAGVDAGLAVKPPTQPCVENRTVDLGIHFDPREPATIDQVQFRVDGDCTVRTHVTGARVADPLYLAELVSFPETPVNGAGPGALSMRNGTDDELVVRVRSLTADFVVRQDVVILEPRMTRAAPIDFVPLASGDRAGTIEVSIGDSYAEQVQVRGHGGGTLAANLDLGPMAVFYGGHEVERRPVAVVNTSDPSDPNATTWVWSGGFSVDSGCAGAQVLGAPQNVAPGRRLTLWLAFSPQSLGPGSCRVTLQGSKPLSFAVKWDGVGVAPCALSIGEPVIERATGRGWWSITNRSERCLLSAPHVEPAQAGSIDVTWQWLWLEGGATVRLPVTGTLDGEAVLYVADPFTRTRRVPFVFVD